MVYLRPNHSKPGVSSCGFIFEGVGDNRRFTFKIPIYYTFTPVSEWSNFLEIKNKNGEGFPVATLAAQNNAYEGKAYSILNGISTGGTMCSKHRQPDEPVEPDVKFGVGHLKLHHGFAYLLYAACFDYVNNVTVEGLQPFRDYVNAQLPDNKENAQIKAFMMDVVDDESIFKRIYDFIKNNNIANPRYFSRSYCTAFPASPMCPTGYAGGAGMPRGHLKTAIPIHHSLVYSSFLFSLNPTNYKLRSISRQFFFKTNYTNAAKPPTGLLQFAHSIDLDGEKYLIGFGNDDAECNIAKIKYDKIHPLFKEKGTGDPGIDIDLAESVAQTNAEVATAITNVWNASINVDLTNYTNAILAVNPGVLAQIRAAGSVREAAAIATEHPEVVTAMANISPVLTDALKEKNFIYFRRLFKTFFSYDIIDSTLGVIPPPA
jgi:hypothetical protein